MRIQATLLLSGLSFSCGQVKAQLTRVLIGYLEVRRGIHFENTLHVALLGGSRGTRPQILFCKLHVHVAALHDSGGFLCAVCTT